MESLELDDIQGLVARGYGRLRAARWLAFRFGDAAAARSWLGRIAPQVTTASQDPRDHAIQLALTHGGLVSLGLPEAVGKQFAPEFREGMVTEHRQRVLGDFGADAPGNWRWGGGSNPPIDGLLMLYATNDSELSALAGRARADLESAGIEVLVSMDTTDIGDVEPFGFRDGISQPVPDGFGRDGRKEDTIRPGEFVLGYANEYGLLTDRPLVPPGSANADLLPPDSAGSADRDLGRNGSYLVVRQLEQDVPGFWKFIDQHAETAGLEPVALATKMVGRWPGGAPLALAASADDAELAAANDFGYHTGDPDGLACPVGAHIRRANPRDSLDPDPGSSDSIAVNKRHRILRRGRAYGPLLSREKALAATAPDGIERGLHFACIVGNISRQFEFVQHTWANNPKFDGLYDEVDPITGPRETGGSNFSMPANPVRTRLTGIPSFVTVRGGAYFFMPGLRAIRYLAALT
ncbi:MAG: Dyp-type peroxidase [Dehalococcoidia bacterium]